jgi:hypothetical protein
MKKYSKAIAAACVLVVLFNLLPYISKAQFDDPDAPIDGGLSLLVVAGVGYGIKKNKERKQQKENKEIDM